MKFSVFGKWIEVKRSNKQWIAYYLGNEEKKRLATDILIPNDITKEELLGYLSDLCHEWASKKYPAVIIL